MHGMYDADNAREECALHPNRILASGAAQGGWGGAHGCERGLESTKRSSDPKPSMREHTSLVQTASLSTNAQCVRSMETMAVLSARRRAGGRPKGQP